MRPSPGRCRLGLAAALVATAAACELPSFGLPESRSEQGDSIAQLWQGFFLTAIVVALIVWGLIIYVLVRYRRRPTDGDRLPDQNPYNIPIEIFYTAVPIVVVAVLFGFSVATERNVNRLDPEPATVVEVIGFQWSWQFIYPDEHITITGEPGQPPELVLPVGQPARLVLRSADVDHSFWTPDFLSKRDLIPGVHNEIEVTPTRTGAYVGRCAEFCGLDHWRMSYTVRVVPPADFQRWLADQRAAAAA